MLFTSTILVLNCQFLDTKIIINNVTAAKEREKKWIMSTINKKVQPLPALFVKTLLFTPIDKCKVAQIDIQPILKCDFCSFLAKIALKSYNYMFFAFSLLYGCPHARLCRLACPRTCDGEFPNLLRLSPNFSPNFL